jgi:hypothetical protein
MNGNYINPLKVEIPPSHPVKEELRNNFERQKKMVIDDLQKIDQLNANEDNPPV